VGRSQLFTENTITPVTVVLTRFGSLPNMLRLWALVFVFNVLGAIAFAAAVVYGDMLRPTAFQVLFDEVATKLEYGFWGATFRAVLGGWLVALMAWLVAASRDTISQVFFVYILALLIPIGDLTHCSSRLLGGLDGNLRRRDDLFRIPRPLPAPDHPREHDRGVSVGHAAQLWSGRGIQGRLPG
jgi:hypothetical protein